MKKPRQFTGRWFRHYEEALNDPKILALSNKQFRFLINCWCLASKHGGVLPEMPELVKLVRIKTKEVAEMVATLRSGEEPLLDEIDGKLTPHNWHLRQFKSDFSAERMRKHRSKNSGDSAAEQQLNSSQSDAEQQDEIKATTTKRSDSTISRDGLVTAPDTYTDTDIVDIPTVVEVHTSPRNVQQTGNGVCVPPVPNGQTPQPDLFTVYWELFVRAGKALNDRDKEAALRVWLGYAQPEHEKIIRWTAEQMRDRWSDEFHTPLPVNNLKSTGWDRKAEPRSIRGPEAQSDRNILSSLQASMAARGYK